MKIDNPWIGALIRIAMLPIGGLAFVYMCVYSIEYPILCALPMALVIGYFVYKALRWKKPKPDDESNN